MCQHLRQHIDSVVPISDEDFTTVLSYFRTKKFKKNQYLIQEGDSVHFEYFVSKGLVKATRTDDSGKDHIIQFAEEGSWITDPQAYYHGEAAMLSVDCLEPTEVLILSLEKREELCKTVPKMEHYFRKKATEEYIEAQKRVYCLISSTARARYKHFTDQQPTLMQRVPKTLIAAYLGVTRETLSRLTYDCQKAEPARTPINA